jgi:hypothetical protein
MKLHNYSAKMSVEDKVDNFVTSAGHDRPRRKVQKDQQRVHADASPSPMKCSAWGTLRRTPVWKSPGVHAMTGGHTYTCLFQLALLLRLDHALYHVAAG